MGRKIMSTGWDPSAGDFPWPPQNATAMSSFHSSDADIRWDDPSKFNIGPEKPQPSVRGSVKLTVLANPATWQTASANFAVTGTPNSGDFLEIGGVLISAVSGAISKDEFDISSGDVNTIAENIKNCVNRGSVKELGLANANSTGPIVILEYPLDGDQGNLVTLSSTTLEVVPSSATLVGGQTGDSAFIGTLELKSKNFKTSGENDFNGTGTLEEVSLSIRDAINDPDNYFGLFTSSSSLEEVTIFVKDPGPAGNNIPVTLELQSVKTLEFSAKCTSGGVGADCSGKSNTQWAIVGINIYRSDTSQRGPYFRVNRVPVASLFYRDHTNITEVVEEIIFWDGGWIFRGDAPNSRSWRIKTRNTPVVKVGTNGIPADSEFDVKVKINNKEVPIRSVFGPKGEIDLDLRPVWDPSTETMIKPIIPTEKDVITVSYSYMKGNKLVNTLDNRHKVFYRLTTVALDHSGTSSTGLVETPLEYCEPISPMNSEKLDYIWREAIRRNRWILEQGGERVKLFIRRVTGNPCDCVWDARLEAYSKQPLNNCLRCYGTGWVGGYEGPIDIIIAPDDNERTVTQTVNGRRLEHSYEVWIGPSPMTSQRDFIVKQNGERYSIGPVRRTQVRGLILQQTFNIGYLDTGDVRYQVPMSPLQRLPWPQTRFTNPEDSECQESVPYPVGYDYQATPMMSDKPSIPEGRQQRGRTPVWQNITYGGKGNGKG